MIRYLTVDIVLAHHVTLCLVREKNKLFIILLVDHG